MEDTNRLENELKKNKLQESPLKKNAVTALSPQKVPALTSSKKQPQVVQKQNNELTSSSSTSLSSSSPSSLMLTQAKIEPGQKRPVIQENNSQSSPATNSKQPKIVWGKASTSGTVSSSQNTGQKRQPIVFNDSEETKNKGMKDFNYFLS